MPACRNPYRDLCSVFHQAPATHLRIARLLLVETARIFAPSPASIRNKSSALAPDESGMLFR
jgi:hypothetical protein